MPVSCIPSASSDSPKHYFQEAEGRRSRLEKGQLCVLSQDLDFVPAATYPTASSRTILENGDSKQLENFIARTCIAGEIDFQCG